MSGGGRESAPVAVFAYARPEHLRATLAALASNELAARLRVVIFSDGARSEADRAAVASVRDVAREFAASGAFGRAEIREREQNAGLADSIVGGVTELVRDEGRAIVVEDDLVTSPHFLEFMNDALDRYEGEDRVMHIAGHMFDIEPEGLPGAFFLRHSSCWGWATWARAWRHLDRDAAGHLGRMSSADAHRFDVDGHLDYARQLRANAEGSLRTWAVLWYASVFRCGGLCLHPRESLVRNIGFDGSGEHCGEIESVGDRLGRAAIDPAEFPGEFEEHGLAMLRYKEAVAAATGAGGTRVRLGRIPGLVRSAVASVMRGVGR
ncbi:MAG: sugar transferase [Planctomycetota bacterium]